MSRHLATIAGVELTAFHGGRSRGRMVQIDMPTGDDSPRQLSRADVVELVEVLSAWLLGIDAPKPNVEALLRELVEIIEGAPEVWRAGVAQAPIESGARILTAAALERIADVGRRLEGIGV